MNPQSSPPSLTDSAELYRACRSADAPTQTAAYRTLWQLLYPAVLYLLRNQPDGAELAQDCAQQALIRVHQRLAECHDPRAFRSWARRIASNLAIDELRRRRRLVALADDEPDTGPASAPQPHAAEPATQVLTDMSRDSLRQLLGQAPISERSRRAVIGRFLDDAPDEALARAESELSGGAVLPSHIQVTRAKNLAKLRTWQPIHEFLQPQE